MSSLSRYAILKKLRYSELGEKEEVATVDGLKYQIFGYMANRCYA